MEGYVTPEGGLHDGGRRGTIPEAVAQHVHAHEYWEFKRIISNDVRWRAVRDMSHVFGIVRRG